MITLLALVPIAIELIKDISQFRKTGTVDHKLGLALRLVFSFLFALYDPLIIFLYAGYHILIFDHVMGYALTSNPFYVGRTSKTDKVIRKIPVNIRTFLRIFLCSVLTSVYYFNDLWSNLF